MLLAKFIHINMDKIKRPKLYTLPDALSRQTSPAAGTIYQAWAVWHRVQTGAACPAPGRVCRCVVRPALAFARPGSGTACPAACDLQSVRVRWGAGVSTGGVYSRRPAQPGQSFNHRKNKKGSKKSPHPLLSISKISRKNKKTPTKGLCSVLYFPYKP